MRQKEMFYIKTTFLLCKKMPNILNAFIYSYLT